MAKKSAVKKAPASKPTKKAAKKAMPKAATPQQTVAQKLHAPTVQRDVIYPEVHVQVCVGDDALIADAARDLLGWEDEEGYAARIEKESGSATAKKTSVKFGNVYDLVDHYGRKVRLRNNPNNRPFDKALAKTWESEILKHHWRLNGETMIIGRTGVTISAQHRLAALILASQEWALRPEKWTAWETEPTIECLVVFGIQEDDDVVNTIDTGRPRSLADVIYRSAIFADMPGSERAKVSRYTASAIAMFKNRVQSFAEAFASKQTHADDLDLLARHPKLLEAVKHCGGKSKVAKYTVNVGSAAAYLYMMGCSSTEPIKYHGADLPNEDMLDFSNWEKACEFVVMLADGHKSFAAVREALAQLQADELEQHTTKRALLCKAWECYVADKPITAKALELVYHIEDDIKRFAENPTFGGIDKGNPKDNSLGEDNEPDSDSTIAADPTPEEIQERAAAVRNDATKRPTKGVKRMVTAADLQQVVWVVDQENVEASWSGTLEEIYDGPAGKVARVKVGKKFSSASKVFEAPLAYVQHQQPTV